MKATARERLIVPEAGEQQGSWETPFFGFLSVPLFYFSNFYSVFVWIVAYGQRGSGALGKAGIEQKRVPMISFIWAASTGKRKRGSRNGMV